MHTRTLFAAGKLPPKRARKVCTQGNHYGRLIQPLEFVEAGGIWRDMGNCSECGSTVSRSQLRGQRLAKAVRRIRSAARHVWRLASGRAALHIRDDETGATRFVFDARRAR